MSVKISVIVPIYNVEKYLDQCVLSILRQTYRQIEVILVDDGSTDSSAKLCDSYKHRDERVVVIHQENQGLVAARKAGLRQASGDYIGFVDGDDYIENDMYAGLMQMAVQSGADIVHSGFFLEDEHGIEKVQGFSEGFLEVNKDSTDFFRLMLQGVVRHNICFKLFRRELIQEIYSQIPDSHSYGEDLICTFMCVIKGCSIALKDQSYYHYVKRENSISQDLTYRKLGQEIQLYNYVSDLLQRSGCNDLIQDMWEGRIIDYMVGVCNQSRPVDDEIQVYSFPDMKSLFGKRIVLYGAGRVGRNYYAQISRYHQCDIVLWVDAGCDQLHYEYMPVMPPDHIKQTDFDVVVIAVLRESAAADIKENLLSMGVEKEKAVWHKPHRI